MTTTDQIKTTTTLLKKGFKNAKNKDPLYKIGEKYHCDPDFILYIVEWALHEKEDHEKNAEQIIEIIKEPVSEVSGILKKVD